MLAAFLVPEGFGETVVENFDVAISGELDVRRLQIAVDDAVVVRFRDLQRDAKRFFPSERTFFNALGERRAFDELEDERVLLKPINRSDMWMIERGEKLASRSKRFIRSASSAKSSGSTLIATSRFSLGSRAR